MGQGEAGVFNPRGPLLWGQVDLSSLVTPSAVARDAVLAHCVLPGMLHCPVPAVQPSGMCPAPLPSSSRPSRVTHCAASSRGPGW